MVEKLYVQLTYSREGGDNAHLCVIDIPFLFPVNAMKIIFIHVVCFVLSCCTLVFGQENEFGSFRSAVALAIAPSGECFVLDGGTNGILRYSRERKLIGHIGGFGWSDTEFDHPTDIISPDALNIYVADNGNHRIQRYDRSLNFVSSLFLRNNEDVDRRFGYPRGVGMSRVGALFIADGENNRVLKIGTSNNIERVFGGVEAGAGKLTHPSRIRVSGNDLVYVQDDKRIVIFDIYGNYVRSVGTDTIKGMRTFTVYNDTLYLLDSCSVRIIGPDGRDGGMIPLYAFLSENECPPADLAVQGDILFILTTGRVVSHRLMEFERLK